MNEQNPTPMTVALGGREITVTKNDGLTEAVKVRLVPIRKLEKYLENIGNVAAIAELVCDKPEGWADSLTDDSLFEIDDVARAINTPRVDRMLKRQKQAVEELRPAIQGASESTNT